MAIRTRPAVAALCWVLGVGALSACDDEGESDGLDSGVGDGGMSIPVCQGTDQEASVSGLYCCGMVGLTVDTSPQPCPLDPAVRMAICESVQVCNTSLCDSGDLERCRGCGADDQCDDTWTEAPCVSENEVQCRCWCLQDNF